VQQKRHVRHSSHERGSNENFNGLLREFLPKVKSLNPLTDEELAQYLSAIKELGDFISTKLHNFCLG